MLRGAVRRARRVGWGRWTCLGVRLTSNAMTLSDQVLASRIVRLHTLAYLRWLLATGEESSGAVAGLEFVPSAQQVAAYARTLEFDGTGEVVHTPDVTVLTEQVEARIARLQCAVHELELRFAGVRVQAASEGGEVVVSVDANGRLVGLHWRRA